MIRTILLCMLLACAATGWTGVEEDRIATARAQLPGVADRYQALIDRAIGARDAAALEAIGTMLWQAAVEEVKAGHADDRSIYWTRLAIRRSIQERAAGGLNLSGFERASRGMTEIDFPDRAARRVLITGFDPFHLDANIDQSNPSGLAALALDGEMLEGSDGSTTASVEAALIPVRFADFDAGLIEEFFSTGLQSNELDLVVTSSMGRDAFDLERFPGRRRSAEVQDNLNVLTGASSSRPLVPLYRDSPLRGPEFVEFSLPAAAMQQVEGVWEIRDNRRVRTLEQGELEPASLNELAGLTAVTGSGGGYLSNEISYRSVLLSQQLRTGVAIGHLHTPRVQGYDGKAERDMVDQIRRMLAAAISDLPQREVP